MNKINILVILFTKKDMTEYEIQNMLKQYLLVECVISKDFKSTMWKGTGMSDDDSFRVFIPDKVVKLSNGQIIKYPNMLLINDKGEVYYVSDPIMGAPYLRKIDVTKDEIEKESFKGLRDSLDGYKDYARSKKKTFKEVPYNSKKYVHFYVTELISHLISTISDERAHERCIDLVRNLRGKFNKNNIIGQLRQNTKDCKIVTDKSYFNWSTEYNDFEILMQKKPAYEHIQDRSRQKPAESINTNSKRSEVKISEINLKVVQKPRTTFEMLELWVKPMLNAAALVDTTDDENVKKIMLKKMDDYVHDFAKTYLSMSDNEIQRSIDQAKSMRQQLLATVSDATKKMVMESNNWTEEQFEAHKNNIHPTHEAYRTLIENMFERYLNLSNIKKVDYEIKAGSKKQKDDLKNYSDKGIIFTCEVYGTGSHSVFIDVQKVGNEYKLIAYSDKPFNNEADLMKFKNATAEKISKYFDIDKKNIQVKIAKNIINANKSCHSTALFFMKAKQEGNLNNIFDEYIIDETAINNQNMNVKPNEINVTINRQVKKIHNDTINAESNKTNAEFNKTNAEFNKTNAESNKTNEIKNQQGKVIRNMDNIVNVEPIVKTGESLIREGVNQKQKIVGQYYNQLQHKIKKFDKNEEVVDKIDELSASKEDEDDNSNIKKSIKKEQPNEIKGEQAKEEKAKEQINAKPNEIKSELKEEKAKEQIEEEPPINKKNVLSGISIAQLKKNLSPRIAKCHRFIDVSNDRGDLRVLQLRNGNKELKQQVTFIVNFENGARARYDVNFMSEELKPYNSFQKMFCNYPEDENGLPLGVMDKAQSFIHNQIEQCKEDIKCTYEIMEQIDTMLKNPDLVYEYRCNKGYDRLKEEWNLHLNILSNKALDPQAGDAYSTLALLLGQKMALLHSIQDFENESENGKSKKSTSENGKSKKSTFKYLGQSINVLYGKRCM